MIIAIFVNKLRLLLFLIKKNEKYNNIREKIIYLGKNKYIFK